jgi:hypothetical protein
MCHHGPQVIAQVTSSAEAGKRKKAAVLSHGWQSVTDGILDSPTNVPERKNESRLQNGTGLSSNGTNSLKLIRLSNQFLVTSKAFFNKPHTFDRYTSVHCLTLLVAVPHRVFSPVHRYTSVDGYTLVVSIPLWYLLYRATTREKNCPLPEHDVCSLAKHNDICIARIGHTQNSFPIDKLTVGTNSRKNIYPLPEQCVCSLGKHNNICIARIVHTQDRFPIDKLTVGTSTSRENICPLPEKDVCSLAKHKEQVMALPQLEKKFAPYQRKMSAP